VELEREPVERYRLGTGIQDLDEFVPGVGAGMVVVQLIDDDAGVDEYGKRENGEE
jgi:hypothetical protein